MKTVISLSILLLISTFVFSQVKGVVPKTAGHGQGIAAAALTTSDDAHIEQTIDVIKREEDVEGNEEASLSKPMFYKNREIIDFAVNTDGSRSLILGDGSIVSLSADGNSVKEISADGKFTISKQIIGNKVITKTISGDIETTKIAVYEDDKVRTETIVVDRSLPNHEEKKVETTVLK